MGKRNKGNKANRHIGHNPDYYKPARSRNVITPGTVVWFGKHKGEKASDVPRGYWEFINRESDWLVVSPELLPQKNVGKAEDVVLTEEQKDIVIEALEDIHDKYSQQMNGDGYYEGIVEGLNIACGIVRVIK